MSAMQLGSPFLKLPIRFDADALAAEVRALPEAAWVPHPTGFVGSEAVRLITPNGEETDDLKGEMAPTEHLLACPYMMQAMAEIGAVWGRSRLMGLGPGGQVPLHVDTHYYWRTHWRIHIPVITNPEVKFTCGDEVVHMAAGECWLFDSFRWHQVDNGGSEQRVHLVLDTVGGGRLRELIEAAKGAAPKLEPKPLAPSARPVGELQFERVNAPIVMSPWELRAHFAFIAEHAVAHPMLATILKRLDEFADDWAAVWARHEADEAGWPDYLRLLDDLKRDLAANGGADVRLTNQFRLYLVLDHLVLVNLFAEPKAVMARASAMAPMEQRRAAS